MRGRLLRFMSAKERTMRIRDVINLALEKKISPVQNRRSCAACARYVTERSSPRARGTSRSCGAILQWLDERRLLDEDRVLDCSDGPNERVVAEGPRRLVKTAGQYRETQLPTRSEITGSDLFAQLGASSRIRHVKQSVRNRPTPLYVTS